MANELVNLHTSRRVFLGSLGALGLVAALAACSDPSSTDRKPGTFGAPVNKNGQIIAGMSYPLSTGFDPMTTSAAVTVAGNWHVLEGLVDLDPATRKPYPALGTALPRQIDPLTWEATLRSGSTFHDGSPVTIDDVVFSFTRVLNPANNSLYLGFLPFIESVKAIDATTVRFSLKYAFAQFQSRISVVKIVPQALVLANPTGYDSLPVGTGPYKYVSATKDDKIVFERFEAYNGTRPALAASMTWNLLSDASARVTAAQSGRVNAIEDVPYLDATALAKTLTVESVQSFGLLFMMFNCSVAPFNDKRVRQAFFYAIDMEKVINTAMLGNATAASSFVQKEHPSYVKAKTIYTYNPTKAKKLLAAAGVSTLAITLLATDTAWVKDVAPLIKEGLEAVGIATTLDIGQSGGQYKKVDDGGLQVMIAPGDPSVFGPDADLLLRWWYSGPVWPTKRYRWADTPEFAEVAALLDLAAAASDTKTQKEMWGKVYDILSENVPLYPLFHRKLPTAWSPAELSGFKPLSVSGLSFLDVASTKA